MRLGCVVNAAANTLVGYVSSSTFSFLAWSVFFADEMRRPSDGALLPGHLVAEAYAPLVLLTCVVIIAAMWMCAIGTLEYIPRLASSGSNNNTATQMQHPQQARPTITPQYVWRQISSTLQNRNYTVLIVGYFFFEIASGIYDTLNVFINTCLLLHTAPPGPM